MSALCLRILAGMPLMTFLDSVFVSVNVSH